MTIVRHQPVLDSYTLDSTTENLKRAGTVVYAAISVLDVL